MTLQQQIILATLLKLMSMLSTNSVSKHQFFNAYLKVCELLLLAPSDGEELEDSYSSLESHAMIRLTDITFLPNPEVVRNAINDDGLISKIATLEF